MFIKSFVCLAAAGSLIATASPVIASDAGLFGNGDPTYDGTYRQSLSILALKSVGRKVPADSVRWLKRQQCKSGGLVEYRDSGTTACPDPDPLNLIGPDLNATALAVAAFVQTGNRKQARKAARWIVRKQNADGGWSYVPGPGATSDSTSTALALTSTALVGVETTSTYLKGVQKRCDAPKAQRGGLSFDTALPEVSDGSTGQSAWLLGGGLELPSPEPLAKSTPALRCSGSGTEGKGSVYRAALGFLAQRLEATGGRLPYGGGYPGVDFAGTASAALALANAGAGRKAVRVSTKYLSRHADEWITSLGYENPGATALLILLADATGEDPRDFGGIDLIKRLNASRQR